MPSLKYLVPRVIRHFMPDQAVRFLLLKSWIIRPGMETNDPARAAEHDVEELRAAGYSLQGKRILVFGYGGRFAVGCALLRAGAAQVILCEKGAPPDSTYNRRLLADFGDYLMEVNGQVLPRGEALKLVQGNIRQLAGRMQPVDIVLSVSVYEHLDDVKGLRLPWRRLQRPKVCSCISLTCATISLNILLKCCATIKAPGPAG